MLVLRYQDSVCPSFLPVVRVLAAPLRCVAIVTFVTILCYWECCCFRNKSSAIRRGGGIATERNFLLENVNQDDPEALFRISYTKHCSSYLLFCMGMKVDLSPEGEFIY
jgi:hypothetical protein